jgi:hypothetical protein
MRGLGCCWCSRAGDNPQADPAGGFARSPLRAAAADPGTPSDSVVGLLLRCQWHRAAAPLAVARRLAVAGCYLDGVYDAEPKLVPHQPKCR